MLPFVYREIWPNKHLRGYIKCYWRYKRKFTPAKTHTIDPHGYYQLIWVRQGILFVNGKEVPQFFVGGQSNSPVELSGNGIVELWSVRFYPWGLAPFGDVAVASSQHQVPAEIVFHQEYHKKLQSLFENANKKTMAADLDDFFLQKLLTSRFDTSILRGAAEYLLQTQGNVTVKDLADYCNLSPRQLERIISKATGKTPRDISARLRFEYVRNAIALQPELPLTTLAHRYGYTDQSHLNKEFRRFTHMSPKEYITRFRATYAHVRFSDVILSPYPEEYHVPDDHAHLFTMPSASRDQTQ